MDTTSDDPKVNKNETDKPNLVVFPNPEKKPELRAVVKKPNPKLKRLPMAHIERTLRQQLDLGKFPQFRIWFPEKGEPQILEEKSNERIVTICSAEKLAGLIAESFNGEYEVTFGEAERIVKRWKWTATRTIANWPASLAFKSENKICFSRLPFDPAPTFESEKFPIISEMLSRMTNAESFCARIGAAFDPNSSRKQVVWLFGDGDSGKSFFLEKIIAKICGGKDGTAFFSGIEHFEKSPHWQEAIVGKSVLIVDEAEPRFLSSPKFKALTGTGINMVNPKGVKMFSAPLSCHLFFTSNEPPRIPSKQELKNRLIICRMTKFLGKKIPPQVLERMLIQELPYFVAKCIAAYKATGGEIQPDTTELDEAIEDFEESYEAIFHRCFKLDPSRMVSISDFEMKVTPHINQSHIKMVDFKEYMLRKFPAIKKGRNNKIRYFKGIREIIHGSFW